MSNIYIFLFIGLLGLNAVGVYGQGRSNQSLSATVKKNTELLSSNGEAPDPTENIVVKVADKNPHNVAANYKAGEMYLRTVDKAKAVKYLMRVLNLNPGYKFNIMYLIGRSYQYGMEFDKAITYFDRYKKKLLMSDDYDGNDKIPLDDVNRRIYECQNAKDFVANKKDLLIINIGPTINSGWEEYAPVLSSDETQLVFTARKVDGNHNKNLGEDGKPFEEIYIAKKINGHWKAAENIGSTINTEFNDSNLALSADGKQLFIYKDVNNGDIYVSNLQSDGSWSTPESIGSTINSSYSENSVSLSPDGRFLFFASNRPGGIGSEENYDIYVAQKNKDGKWGRAKNLGEAINTDEDDESPFIDYDGKTLYFSTKGKKGMGGFDIFKSVFNNNTNTWSDPENLGYPINTPDDDIHFVSTKDGKRGYYASVRDDSHGRTDIYMVTISEDVDEKLYIDSDRDGIFDYEDKCPDAPGSPENNGCPGIGSEDKDVLTTAFANLEFETASSNIRSSSFQSLDGLVKLLKKHDNWKILLEGHTDNIGNKDSNMQLSEKRAQAVAEYLKSNSIGDRRLLVFGYGSAKPITDNDSEEGRQRNRRVEMTVIVE